MVIEMKRKELIKTFMMISNWKKPFGLHVLYTKYFSTVGLRVNYSQIHIQFINQDY